MPGLSVSSAVLLAIAGYVVTIGAFSLAGYHAFVFKTTLVPLLLLVALVGHRVESFIQDWIVFLAVIVLFDAVRGLVFASAVVLQRPLFIQYPIRWETLLFGTPAVSIPLQHAFRVPNGSWLDSLCIVMHASHFAFFLLFGLAVWAANRREFGRWALVMMLTMGGGLVFYASVPTVPPWLASQQGAIPPLEHIAASAYNTAMPTLQAVLDTNPVAAMPSLHAAFPTVCALAAVRVWGPVGGSFWLYAAAMTFALTYLGEHYAVDVLAGIILAVVAHAAVASRSSLARWTNGLGWCRWPAMRHFTVAMAIVLVAVLLSCWTIWLVPALQP
jgi:membrane-associated phospholipid phosphatase